MPAAEEICLTAHHEGGFSLWDTKYSNYSVMQSPYGKDIVAQFVASCQKFGVKPCYYFPPSANGYMVTHNYTAEEFVEAQLGQLAPDSCPHPGRVPVPQAQGGAGPWSNWAAKYGLHARSRPGVTGSRPNVTYQWI